ncbi:MAG: cobalamin biosynthesis protein CobQ [Leptolyngbya sp. RL_3_1]|nr:cobalamin biosynthesis protein CobQ [Leptolyngbya sp. RL_3_1]
MASSLIKRYSIALQRYKWFGLGGFVGILGAATVAAVAVVVFKPPAPPDEYVSEGILVQNAPLVSLTNTGLRLQQEGQGIITEDFLLADVLLEQVVQLLAQQGITVSPGDLRRITEVEIKANEDNQLQRVLIKLTWDDGEEAELILSTMFEGMIELSRITNKARLTALIEALDERIPAVESELREAESALETYDRTELPAVQAALDGSLLEGITSSQSQRRQNQVTLAGIEAQMRSLQNRLGMTPEQAYASSALSADPIIAQLRTQIYQAETQLAALAQDLRPAHPTMVDLQYSLDSYEQLLRERAREVLDGADLDTVRQRSSLDPARAQLANQLVALSTQRDTLIQQQQLLAQSDAQMRQQYASVPNIELERQRLAQQVAFKQSLFEQLQARRLDAEAADAETVSSLTVANPPATQRVESAAAAATNPLVILVGGAGLGLVVGAALIFLLDMVDSTIRTYEDLEKLFKGQDVPILGIVPSLLMPAANLPPLIKDMDSPYGDLYERLRSNLYLSGIELNEGKAPRTVLITSTGPQEGKTITAFNLGIAAARAGKRTLVIEADLRSPSQAAQLGVTVDEQAALEPLRYYGGYLSEPVKMVPGVENLFVAPSVGPQRNAAMVIDSSEMDRFIADAQVRFDFVILDAPHLSGSNDAMLWEPRTDGLVLVTRPNHTEKPILIAAMEQLEEAEEIQLLGAVINDTDGGMTATIAAGPTAEDAPPIDNGVAPPNAAPKKVPAMTPIDF